jgi:hypothetical protein
MATQEGFEWHGAGDTYVEHYLYHLLGDPTMQMWSAPPVRFDPGRFRGVIQRISEIKVPQPGDPPFFVHFELNHELALGTLVTVFRNGNEAVGRGVVGANGIANIIPDVPFGDQDNLSVSLQQDGALPAQEKVDNPPITTTMTASCAASPHDDVQPMTTSGTLSPAFAAANIKLTYTRPNNGGTLVRTVQTNANGAWTDTITPTQQAQLPDGVWTIRADYEGDATHNPSSAECTVTVNNQ